METTLRCSVPDRPGALAAVAGAIADAGGDIAAVDVVETAGGVALDDFVVEVGEGRLAGLVDGVGAVDGVHVVHVGPSRGVPGDAVARLALGLESLLNGAMALEHAVTTLVGGLLGARSAELVSPDRSPRPGDKVFVAAFDERVLVVRRDYRFTDAERARAAAILRACIEAARVRAS